MTPLIVQAKGGLGNQLFQFAFALWFKKLESRSIYFDISILLSLPSHQGFALRDLFPQFTFNLTNGNTFRIPHICINFDPIPSWYHPCICQFQDPVYAKGYFQNAQYLHSTLGFIRDNLNSSTPQRRMTQLCESPRICLHLRRGDYLSGNNVNVHGTITLSSILHQAMILVDSYRLSGLEPEVCLYSDQALNPADAATISKHSLTDVKINSSNSYLDDFFGVGDAEHVICTNSTFGYWAGLLSSRAQTIWIPSVWMKSNLVRSQDLLCDRVRVYNAEFCLT